jgi:hypothetical protein
MKIKPFFHILSSTVESLRSASSHLQSQLPAPVSMINPAKCCTIDAPAALFGKVNNAVNSCADPELGVRERDSAGQQ